MIGLKQREDDLMGLVGRGTNLLSQMWFAGAFTRLHARVYRLTRGHLVGRWFGMPILILEVRGRRSGALRSTPMIYLRDGTRFVVVAANSGAPARHSGG